MAAVTSTAVVALPVGGAYVALTGGETYLLVKATGAGKVVQPVIVVGAAPAAGAVGYPLDEDERLLLTVGATEVAYARSGDPTKASEVTIIKRV